MGDIIQILTKSNERGQTSIEFMFLLLIIIVYLFTVTKPILASAQGAFEDIDAMTKGSAQAQKLVNSIHRMSALGDSSHETLLIALPAGATILCNPDGNIELKVSINQGQANPPISNCPNNICDKNYFAGAVQCSITSIEGVRTIIVAESANTVVVQEG